ncbi:MAG TPA: TVP38/TMEM64 family protein [Stellaceae bacterium]|jgi:uncharacterized membrane protein YdjX (TVP38/TMEM64 family)|nr:TVP38/TMEM64 family protein [Stellaceae bacterium]
MAASKRARRAKKKPEWREWLPWIGVAVVVAGLCAAWFLLPLREWLDALQNWLRGLGAWGVAILVLILFVMTFLPAPDWPLPIAAGYVYGVWAFPIVYFSVAFASALAFLAARYLARDRVRAFLGRRPKYRPLDKAVAEDGWAVVALVRLSPIVPFNLQNYAFGATGIPFWQYLTATLAGIIPGIALYVYFGIVGEGLGKGKVSPLEWALLGVGIVATIGLSVLVTRKTQEKLSETRKSR